MNLFKSKKVKELEKTNNELECTIKTLKELCETASKNSTNYTKELMDMFNKTCEKKFILFYDLSELPKGKKLEDVLDTLKKEGVVMVETKSNNEMKSKIVWY